MIEEFDRDDDSITMTFDAQVNVTKTCLERLKAAGDEPEEFTVVGMFGDKDNTQFNICQGLEKYCQTIFPYLYIATETSPWRWKCSVQCKDDRAYVKDHLVWLFNRVYDKKVNIRKPSQPTGFKHVRNRVARIIEVLTAIVEDEVENQIRDDIRNLQIKQSGLDSLMTNHSERLVELEAALNVNRAGKKRSKTDQVIGDQDQCDDYSITTGISDLPGFIQKAGAVVGGEELFKKMLMDSFSDSMFFFTKVQSAAESYCILHVNSKRDFRCVSEVKPNKNAARSDAFRRLLAELQDYYNDYDSSFSSVVGKCGDRDDAMSCVSSSSCSSSDEVEVSIYETLVNQLLDNYFLPNPGTATRGEIVVTPSRAHDPDARVKKSIYNKAKKIKDRCNLKALESNSSVASGAMKLVGRLSNQAAIIGGKKDHMCTVQVIATKTLTEQGIDDEDTARRLFDRIHLNDDRSALSALTGSSSGFMANLDIIEYSEEPDDF